MTKKTTKVSRTTAGTIPAEIAPGIPNPAMADAASSTQYANEPIKGGTTEIILNNIMSRAPVRIKQDIQSWRQALMSAESRYYPNRTRLYDIYADIRLDAHLAGIISKRISTILNTPIYLHDKQGEKVEELDTFLESMEFRKIIREIMETQFWGITGLEFIPGTEVSCRIIPRKHIKTKTQLISIEQNIQEEGYDYTKLDNVWIIGEPEDLGLLNQVAPLALYKRGAIADWANFIEIFGQPMRVAKYDPYDPTTEEALRKAIETTGSMLGLLIPKTADFEVKDSGSANANGDLQAKFVSMLDQQMSIAILGNTETTSNSGTGSQAKSKTHQNEQREITRSDLNYVRAALNNPHFLRILESYGFKIPQGAGFKFQTEIDWNYLSQRVNTDLQLAKGGLPIARDYFYDTYDIPKPDPKEAILNINPQQEEEEPAEEPAPKKKTTPKKQTTPPKEAGVTRAEMEAMFKSFFG